MFDRLLCMDSGVVDGDCDETDVCDAGVDRETMWTIELGTAACMHNFLSFFEICPGYIFP